MKIERISENKIKVLINDEDIRLWNVDIKKITENSPEAQNLFRHALKQAEEELDFSADGSRLVVEAAPLKESGFVMIISKIISEKEFFSALSKGPIHFRFEEKCRKAKPKNPAFWIYKFLNFEDLCKGIKHISADFVGYTAVYKLLDNYYLKLKPLDGTDFNFISNKLCEFSSPVKNSDFMGGYIEEHGISVAKGDAVETLMSYFG